MNSEQIIQTLLMWNFWEKDIDIGILRAGYLDRLKKYLATDEIVCLIGVRRSGKSTILLQMLVELFKNNIPKKNTLYINFEDSKFYNSLKLDLLDDIWKAYLSYLKPKGKVYLILDEIQKIKGWEHWVRSMYDRKENVKIFITGSNAKLLSSEFSTLLTGRHLQIFVYPLNFNEFLFFKGLEIKNDKLWLLNKKNDLENLALEYLKIGGFPKIILAQDELLRNELLSQYFNDILIKDIVERHKIKDISKLKNLALFYSTNFTRGFTFNNIKKITDFILSIDSIDRFSNYLEESFLIDFMPRFSYSIKNQMQTERKVYLVDNGIHNAVAFKFSEDKGKLLENIVFQLLKSTKKEIYYFSEKKEVDFVCKEGLKVKELINVCYNIENKDTLLRETSALYEGMKYFKLNKAKIIIAEGNAQEIINENQVISVIPFYQWAMGLVQ